MNTNVELLQDQMDEYQQELKSIKSYVKELKNMAARHGTDEAHYQHDLVEAEHNAGYYEEEITRIKKELGAAGKDRPPAQAVSGSTLPQLLKPGVNALIFSSISFVAGVLLGSMLLARRDSQNRGE